MTTPELVIPDVGQADSDPALFIEGDHSRRIHGCQRPAGGQGHEVQWAERPRTPHEFLNSEFEGLLTMSPRNSKPWPLLPWTDEGPLARGLCFHRVSTTSMSHNKKLQTADVTPMSLSPSSLMPCPYVLPFSREMRRAVIALALVTGTVAVPREHTRYTASEAIAAPQLQCSRRKNHRVLS
jgi:hypothetical protein